MRLRFGMAKIEPASQQPQQLDQLEKQLTGWQDPAGRLLQALEHYDLELSPSRSVSLEVPGKVQFAEVLVRMREEEKALLAPGMFRSAFEYCGMMYELDRWIGRQVIKLLAAGSRVPCLSINISAQTLSEFVGHITAELRRANVPAAALAFEISERRARMAASAVRKDRRRDRSQPDRRVRRDRRSAGASEGGRRPLRAGVWHSSTRADRDGYLNKPRSAVGPQAGLMIPSRETRTLSPLRTVGGVPVSLERLRTEPSAMRTVMS